MHIVPAPAESLMKSRVLSIPGLQGVKDETWDGYRLFRLSGGAVRRFKKSFVKLIRLHELSVESATTVI